MNVAAEYWFYVIFIAYPISSALKKPEFSLSKK